jgi:hypothetical protein
MDEIGFIQRRERLGDGKEGRNAAFRKYLELAGVKIERRPPPSTLQPEPEPRSEGEQPAQAHKPNPENVIPFSPNRASGPKKPKSDPPSGRRPSDVWAVFHSRIPLTSADRARLRDKRGFAAETIDRLGFRSSVPENIAAIESLRKDFPDYLLLESGLFKMQMGKMVPERQFAGFGNTGRKDNKGELIWEYCNPILIPYLDHDGRVVSMRPHKGNIAKRDKDDDESCGGDIYCSFLLETRLDGFEDTSPLFGAAILTEAEFKAGALWQAGFPAIGIPGTGFVRNPVFRSRLVETIDRAHITKLIIVFDNEVKDNPALASYKPDPFERYWTVIWARYIAWDLMNCTPRPSRLNEVLIGQLPDEWRLDDEGKDTGKIDWDTALANFVKREGPIHGTARATREFERVLLEAHTPADFVGLFPKEAQVIITTRLNHLFHKPLLKSGGSKEEKLARRLDKIGNRSTVQIQQWAEEMVSALRSVAGSYYVLKPPTDKMRLLLLKIKEDLNDKIAELQRHRGEKAPPGIESVEDKLERLILERRLVTEKIDRGIPDPVSNFILECRYCLHTAAGTTERMITIRNTQGEETPLLRLPGDNLARLAEFRSWCLTHAHGVPVWHGGEKDLQALTKDMKLHSAWRNVYEVPHFGYASNSKIWFAGDCAWPPDASMILPNIENISWHNGLGYTIGTTANLAYSDQPDDGFQQGAPSFIRNAKTEPNVRELFELLSHGLMDTVGDYDGLLCIGVMLLYAAGPEVYREHGGHPGLWLFGKKGSGKTTIARWLMKIWGFKDLQGTRIDKGSTPVAMARMLTQYSCLPVWFDEYRRNIPDVELKESVLRGAFDRSAAGKGRMDSSNRTNSVRALTTPFITGESSSSDAATRSRYVHVIISPSRRRLEKSENDKMLRTIQSKSDSFYAIGRYLMDHRAAFVSAFLSYMDIWMKNQLVINDDRTRFVHGAGWAAYLAFAEMINANPCDATAFSNYVVQHSQQAFEDAHEETMVNRFWSEVIGGINTGAISRSFFFEKEIALDGKGRYDPSSISLEDTPKTNVIFMAAQEIYHEYEKDMRHRGNSPALSRADIQREISKEPYWVEAAAPPRVHRIQHNGKRYTCWAINVEKFPFGQILSDALQTATAVG